LDEPLVLDAAGVPAGTFGLAARATAAAVITPTATMTPRTRSAVLIESSFMTS